MSRECPGGVLAQLDERDERLEFFLELHVDAEPARLVAANSSVVILALRIERAGVRKPARTTRTMPAMPGSGQLE